MHGSANLERHCVYCTRSESEVGELSHRGICNGCGKARIEQAMDQISAGTGPIAEARIDGIYRHARTEVARLRGASQAA